jgi:hypothetical protein
LREANIALREFETFADAATEIFCRKALAINLEVASAGEQHHFSAWRFTLGGRATI